MKQRVLYIFAIGLMVLLGLTSAAGAEQALARFQARVGAKIYQPDDNPFLCHMAYGFRYDLPAGYGKGQPLDAGALVADLFGVALDFLHVRSVTYGDMRIEQYMQQVRGIPIYPSRLLMVSRAGVLVALGADILPGPEALEHPLQAKAGLMQRLTGLYGVKAECLAAEPIYFAAGDQLRPAYKVRLHVPRQALSRVDILASGDFGVLASYNLVKNEIYSGDTRASVVPFDFYEPEEDKDVPFVQVKLLDGSQERCSTESNKDADWSVDCADYVNTARGRLSGRFLDVTNAHGASALYESTDLSSPVPVYFDDSNSLAEERTAFYYSMLGKMALWRLDPGFNGMNYAVPLQVDLTEDDVPFTGCNAFWDGYGLNFLDGVVDGVPTCNNMAQVADIVLHEYAHGVTQYVYSPYVCDDFLNEAFSDYFAATLSDDPVVGEASYLDGSYWRTLVNDMKYPDDVTGECHYDSQILSGVIWSIRQQVGQDDADKLYHFCRYLLPQDPYDLFLAFMLLDDDNEDLSDGTPHYEAIVSSFEDKGVALFGFHVQDVDIIDSVGKEVEAVHAKAQYDLTLHLYNPGRDMTAAEVSLSAGAGIGLSPDTFNLADFVHGSKRTVSTTLTVDDAQQVIIAVTVTDQGLSVGRDVVVPLAAGALLYDVPAYAVDDPVCPYSLAYITIGGSGYVATGDLNGVKLYGVDSAGVATEPADFWEYGETSLKTGLLVHDMDSDGDEDLILISNLEAVTFTNPMRVKAFSQDNGTLSDAPVFTSTMSGYYRSGCLADISGDGRDDLVLSLGPLAVSGQTSGKKDKAYKGTSQGFSDTVVWQSDEAEISTDIFAADVNGDTFRDIVVAWQDEGIAVYYGSGTAVAETASYVKDLDGCLGCCLYDLHTDGDMDVLAYSNDSVYVLENTGGVLNAPLALITGLSDISSIQTVQISGQVLLVVTDAQLGASCYAWDDGMFNADAMYRTRVKNHYQQMLVMDCELDGDEDLLALSATLRPVRGSFDLYINQLIDGSPPAANELLDVFAGHDGLGVVFSNSGDDFYLGQTAGVDIRIAQEPMETAADFTAAPCQLVHNPSVPFSVEQVGFTPSETWPEYYVALRSIDDQGNTGEIACAGPLPLSPVQLLSVHFAVERKKVTITGTFRIPGDLQRLDLDRSQRPYVDYEQLNSAPLLYWEIFPGSGLYGFAFQDTQGLRNSRWYYYRLRCLDGSGRSCYSGPAQRVFTLWKANVKDF